MSGLVVSDGLLGCKARNRVSHTVWLPVAFQQIHSHTSMKAVPWIDVQRPEQDRGVDVVGIRPKL
jgi:hypothetical protein